jgi:hypothetical protein
MDETLSRDADAAARIIVHPVRSEERASTETWDGRFSPTDMTFPLAWER